MARNEGMFHEEPGTLKGPKHDDWGHIETLEFPDKSMAGVMERIGPDNTIVACRLLYVKNGDPGTGYDRVWEYPTIEAATDALRAWAGSYPNAPEGFTRDFRVNPIPCEE